jgi:DNA-directed RNA polymerase specialized sigma24 family protein
MTTSNDIRDVRARMAALGETLLLDWADHRAADLERAGAQPNRTLQRAREMQEGHGAKSTATEDAFGDPLLNPMERIADRFHNTLSVESWVSELPDEHRNAIVLYYVERRHITQIASMMGVDRKHAGYTINDAEVMVARRMLAVRGVNDPSHLRDVA